MIQYTVYEILVSDQLDVHIFSKYVCDMIYMLTAIG